MTCCNSRRKPEWLKIKLPKGQSSTEVLNIVRKHNLHTICTSGMCPNQGECWGNRTATFMIGGDVCTRSCKFCNVKTGRPAPLDPAEPENIANSIKLLGLKHAVITSVDRDDLADLGAAHESDRGGETRESPNDNGSTDSGFPGKAGTRATGD